MDTEIIKRDTENNGPNSSNSIWAMTTTKRYYLCSNAIHEC